MEEKLLVSMLTSFKTEIIEAFDQRIGIVEENSQHKLDLVVEGQQMLAERMDRMESRFDERFERLEQRIDAVAVDISEHRKDTEAHHGVYKVRE